MSINPLVLVFSATDGCGGAGTLMDYRVLSHAHCHPLSIITAVSAQNLDGVQALWQLSAPKIEAQFKALQTKAISAIKIGVTGPHIACIARCLQKYPNAPVVFDPVLNPSRGIGFVTPRGLASMRTQLLQHCDVITPNRQELLTLAMEKNSASATRALLKKGVKYCLITDINGRGKQVRHLLFSGQGKTPLWEADCHRRPGLYHGSGCFFSSALTAQLAHGKDIVKSAEIAHQQTLAAIDAATAIPSLGKQLLL